MEGNGRSTSRSRLRQRLARVFRQPALLYFSCNPSSSPTATIFSSGDTRRALLSDVVYEPVFVPRRLLQDSHDDKALGCRSFSLPTTDDRRRRPPLTESTVRRSFDCSGCRHYALELTQTLFSTDKKKKTKTKKDTRKTLEITGDGAGESPPVPISSPWKSSYYDIYCLKKRVDHTTKKLSTNPYGFSSSSSIERDHELGFYSGEEEEEIFFKNKMKIKKKEKYKFDDQSYEDWGRCQGFQPLISINGSSKDQKSTGYAVTKRSMNPYGDFRRSMAEMIIERKIFGAGDLEGLLQSYLLLNSPTHHSIIIEAFSDICFSLFCN